MELEKIHSLTHILISLYVTLIAGTKRFFICFLIENEKNRKKRYEISVLIENINNK
jgi:hypothetical protein